MCDEFCPINRVGSCLLLRDLHQFSPNYILEKTSTITVNARVHCHLICCKADTLSMKRVVYKWNVKTYPKYMKK